MPLPRAALYGQGENSILPFGQEANITPKTLHGLLLVITIVCGFGLKPKSENDFPLDTPYLDELLQGAPDILANGGSAIVNPDGEWLIPPIVDQEGIFYHSIELDKVYQERQNFDPVGHYLDQMLPNSPLTEYVSILTINDTKD